MTTLEKEESKKSSNNNSNQEILKFNDSENDEKEKTKSKMEENFDQLNNDLEGVPKSLPPISPPQEESVHSHHSEKSHKSQNSLNMIKKPPIKINNNQRYGTDTEEDKKKNCNDTEENKGFITTGKFMQINPHFHIFNKQIDTLRESIYDDTKKCLILKGSLQESSNILKEESNSVIKEIVQKIYDLRELLEKGNKGLNKTVNEVTESMNNLAKIQNKARKEINDCDNRISECENQIGYKLLGKPCYSFMDKNNITNLRKHDNNKDNNGNDDKEDKKDENEIKYEV